MPKITYIAYELYKAGRITFAESIVLAQAVTDWVAPSCLPSKYAEAQKELSRYR